MNSSVQKLECSPSAHRAPHPTDIHAPSKINFPFRPCSMFSSGPLLRESLHDSSFGAYGPVECVQDEGRERGREGGGLTFDVQQQKRGKITDYNSLPTLRLLLMMQKATGEKKTFSFCSLVRGTFFPLTMCAMADHQGLLAAERER